MPPEERSGILARCIREALDKAPRPQGSWDEAYVALLTERLQKLLLAWIEHELERSPFTVLEQEHASEITVGPLTLRVRVDRVDQVEDGVVVVDYKTGYAADPKRWEGPRPDEPQLPLYALLAEPGELRGVAFARVRAGDEKRWTGYTDREGLLPRKGSRLVDLDWQTQEWRAILEDLASAFFTGRADVHPKKHTVNCAHCAQRLLVPPGSRFAARGRRRNRGARDRRCLRSSPSPSAGLNPAHPLLRFARSCLPPKLRSPTRKLASALWI